MRSLSKFAAFLAGTALVAFVFQLQHGLGTRSWIIGAICGAIFGGVAAYTAVDSLTEPVTKPSKIRYTNREKFFWISYYAISTGLIYSYFGMVWFSIMDQGFLGIAVGFVSGAVQSAAAAHKRLRKGKVKRVQQPFTWMFIGLLLGTLYGIMLGVVVARLYRAETLWIGIIGGAIYGAMHGLAFGGYLSLENSKQDSINVDMLLLNMFFAGITSTVLFAIYLQHGGMWQAVILTLCFGSHLILAIALGDESVGLTIVCTAMLIACIGGMVHSQWSERVLHWKLEAHGVQTWATYDGCSCNKNSCWLKATYQIDDNQTLKLREDVYRGMCRHKKPTIRVTYLPDSPSEASVKSHSSAGLGWLLTLPFFSFMLISSSINVDAGLADPKKKK